MLCFVKVDKITNIPKIDCLRFISLLNQLVFRNIKRYFYLYTIISFMFFSFFFNFRPTLLAAELIVKENAFIRCTMKEKIFYNQICVINGKIDCQKIRTKKKIIPNEEQSYLPRQGNSFLASAIHKNCDIISR